MRNAVLVSAVRTPVGKMGGVFKSIDRLDMTDAVIKEAIARAGISSDMVEENILWMVLVIAAVLVIPLVLRFTKKMRMEVEAHERNQVQK